MKVFVFLAVILAGAFASTDEYDHGYLRQNGTYVNLTNNYSPNGNVRV